MNGETDLEFGGNQREEEVARILRHRKDTDIAMKNRDVEEEQQIIEGYEDHYLHSVSSSFEKCPD